MQSTDEEKKRVTTHTLCASNKTVELQMQQTDIDEKMVCTEGVRLCGVWNVVWFLGLFFSFPFGGVDASSGVFFFHFPSTISLLSDV
jgi:hypothetical protein